METTELEERMAGRVRRHMITSAAGFGGAVLLMVLAGAAVQALFRNAPPTWATLLPALAILVIPAVGFRSTFKNLRCPACDKLVALQVSQNYSVFSRRANKACAGCGKKIFPDDLAARYQRLFFILMAVGIALGVVAAMLSAVLAPR